MSFFNLNPRWESPWPVTVLMVRLRSKRFYGGPVGGAAKRGRYGGYAGDKAAGAAVRLNKRSRLGLSTAGSLSRQVKSLQKVVKTLTPELKYLDTAMDASNIPGTGSVVHLTGLAQGTGQGNRVGNSVNITSVYCAGFWVRNITDPSINALTRIAIVCDKEQIGDTAPTAADIFSIPGEPTFVAPNLSNLERFRILHISHIYDSNMMGLDSDNIALRAPTQQNVFEYMWKGNIKVSFNGTAVTDVEKNNIYVVYLSNDTVIDFDGTCRIGYTDM